MVDSSKADVTRNTTVMGSFLLYPFVCALILSVLLAWIAPLSILVNNPVDFPGVSPLGLLSQSLLHFALIFIGTAALLALLRQASVRLSHIVSAFLLAFTVATLFYVSLRIGKMDGIDVPKLRLGWLALLTLGFGAAATFKPRLLALIATVFALTGAAPVLTQSAALKPAQIETGIPKLSTDRNVIVLVLDGMMAQSAHRVLAEHSDLREDFAGFASFENAVATAPYTNQSLQTIKTGSLEGATSNGALNAAHRDTQITAQLHKAGWNVSTRGIFNEYSVPGTTRYGSFKAEIGRSGVESYQMAVTAAYQRILPAMTGWYASISRMISPAGGPDGYAQRLLDVIERHDHPLAYYKNDLLDFRRYAETVDVGADAPSAHFIYSWFTHDPLIFEGDCTPVLGRQVPMQEQLDTETECGLREVAGMVRRLKALDVFDDSLLILSSDHGMECEFAGLNDAPKIMVNARWCLSRYMPLLMIKAPQDQVPFRVAPDEVGLLDLASTICPAAGLEDCANYEGVDLLSRPVNKDAPRRILLPRSDEDIRDISGYKVVDIGRQAGVETHFGIVEAGYVDGVMRSLFQRDYAAGSLPRQTGRVIDDQVELVAGQDAPGYAAYGPYVAVPAGRYVVTLEYQSDLSTDVSIGTFDIASDNGRKIHASKTLPGTNGARGQFSLDVDLDANTDRLEARTLWRGEGTLTLNNLRITQKAAD